MTVAERCQAIRDYAARVTDSVELLQDIHWLIGMVEGRRDGRAPLWRKESHTVHWLVCPSALPAPDGAVASARAAKHCAVCEREVYHPFPYLPLAPNTKLVCQPCADARV